MLLLIILSIGIVHSVHECDKSPKDLKGCNVTDVCTADAAPVCNTTTGCPNCFPSSLFRSTCKLSRDIAVCGTDELPTLKWNMIESHVSLCPSCIPREEPTTNACADKVKECAQRIKFRTIRYCHNGAKPFKDPANCCFSCLPFRNETHCQHMKCDYATARDCKDGEESKRVGCCRSCKNAIKKGRNGKCSKEDFKKAIELTPECEGFEKPMTDDRVKSCAPSCRRAESGYSLKDVIDCLKARKECVKGVEEPYTLPGSRCAVCDKPRRKCDKECEEGERCIVKVKNETTVREKCVKKRKLRLRFKAKGSKATLTKLKSLDKTGIVKAILEMVARFCERNSESKRCKKFHNVVRETLECKNKRDGDDVVDVDLELSSETDEWTEDTTSRRLLADDASESFLMDAVKDEDSVEVETVDSDGDDSGSISGNMISGMSLFMSMILFSI